jgi:lambda family phage tail tape measure protein
MANNVGRLGVVLGLNSAEFVAGIEGASKKLEQFAEKAIMAGKTAAVALTAAAAASLKYADDIYETAKANEVAIDTIVKMKLALNQSGGAAENATKFMSSFTAFVDKAAGGSFEAQKTFQKLGVSLKDIGTMSMDALLAKTTAGLSQQADAITRNAMAMEMFGKSAKGVDMLDFTDGMAATNKVTEQQIKGIQEAGKFFDLLGKQAHNTAMTFTEVLAPAMTKINELLDGYVNKNRNLIDTLHDAYNKFLPGMIRERLPLYMNKTPGGNRGMGFPIDTDEPVRETKKGKDPEIERAKHLLEQRRKYTEEIMRENERVYGHRKKFSEEMMQDNDKAAEKRYQASIKQMDEEAKIMRLEEDHQHLLESNALAYRENERMQSKQLDNERELFLVGTQYKDLKSYELKYAQDVVAIRQKYAEQEYQIKMLANEQKLSLEEEAIALANNNELRQKSIDQAREVLEVTRQSREGTMTEGFTKGFDEFVRDMPTRMELGKTAFNSLIGSMDNALRQFVQTGKINFADLIRSMVQELMYLESKAKMMDIMKSLKGGGGGGGIMGMLGGLFGGGTPFMGVPSGMAMADGGDPPVGMATLVGERGPEMFVPRAAGTIIPNNQLSNMGGGGQTVNYNGPYIASMSAIDTQTGVQFLAKNKQTIWASYQSANRSVPVSR